VIILTSGSPAFAAPPFLPFAASSSSGGFGSSYGSP